MSIPSVPRILSTDFEGSISLHESSRTIGYSTPSNRSQSPLDKCLDARRPPEFPLTTPQRQSP